MQLWTFIDEYLRTAPARGMATTEILAFLFEIGFCKPRQGYAISALNDTQRSLLDDFASFGLVYVPEQQDVLMPEELPAEDKQRGLAAAAERRQTARRARQKEAELKRQEKQQQAQTAAANRQPTKADPAAASGGWATVSEPSSSSGGGGWSAVSGDGTALKSDPASTIKSDPAGDSSNSGDGMAIDGDDGGPIDEEAEEAAAAEMDALTAGFDYDDPYAARRFFPTSLAVILTNPDGSSASTFARMSEALARGAAAGGTSASSSGGTAAPSAPTALKIVVEKNFKVYAYTTVDLHLALLALFAKIELKLPNLIVATLTRRSVLSAMDKGIKADQIRAFLRAHAHPSVTSQGLDVPENVVDQLYIWQAERHRVRYSSGALFTSFDSPEQFRALLAFLLAKDGILFADEAAQAMVVHERCMEDARNWVKAQREGSVYSSSAGAGAGAGGEGGGWT